MKKMYVLRMDADWDVDYVRVFTSAKATAKAIVEEYADYMEYLDEHEVLATIKEREAQGCVYIWLDDEDRAAGLNLMMVPVE